MIALRLDFQGLAIRGCQKKFNLKNLDVKVYLKYVGASLKFFWIWFLLVAYNNMIQKIGDFLGLTS